MFCEVDDRDDEEDDEDDDGDDDAGDCAAGEVGMDVVYGCHCWVEWGWKPEGKLELVRSVGKLYTGIVGRKSRCSRAARQQVSLQSVLGSSKNPKAE